jgi:glutamate 5-kinase
MGNKKQTIVVRIEISTLLGSNGKISPKKMDRLAMVITNLHNSGSRSGGTDPLLPAVF